MIPSASGNIKTIILSPKNQNGKVPGILWIHGGGYAMGMAEMVYFSCGKMLAERHGAVVICPDYRLSVKAAYPAALEDCFTVLQYMIENRDVLGIDRIVVGGESAGGGLTAALCIYARDRGIRDIVLQLPLYPMLDYRDTDSSRDNHGRVWNTRRNHWGWKKYLGELYEKDDITPYASPAHEKNYAGLPPCYTFVSDGEPFYSETMTYVRNLQKAGIRADVDVYHGNVHAFDLLLPWTARARKAREKLSVIYGHMMKSA